MAPRHARPSRSPVAPSGAEALAARSSGWLAHASTPPGCVGVDPLSDVLRTVRLTGALFFRVEASSPWTIEVPDASTLATAIQPRTHHVISYHVVTRGSCWGALLDGLPTRLTAGDVLVFPRGDAYVMSITRAMDERPAVGEVLAFMRAMSSGQLPFTVIEGGGGPEQLDLLCGFLGCDLRPFNPLLATLPPMLHVRATPPLADDPLSHLIHLTVTESREPRAGGECVRLRLSELMFVEVVRRHLAALPAEQAGWLAALRDPGVGQAVALLHARPAHAWTLATLAKEVGLSRSSLADRFTHLVGDPPMQYLTRWRMQLAARLLADGEAKVSAVGRQVGYESEAAFSRAFKKVAGVAPAAWRRRRGARG